MPWLCRWSVAIGGVAAACGAAVMARVLARYRDVGTVNWNDVFEAVLLPILIFCIVRFGERQMERADVAVRGEAPAQVGREKTVTAVTHPPQT